MQKFSKIQLILKIIFLTTLITPLYLTIAQTGKLSFENLSMNDGLSQSTVYSILQDSRGFMWFGTRAGGLNKYDGHSFKVYKKNSSNSHNISSNQIISLCEDNYENIWAGSRNEGLNRFDIKTERFYNYFHDKNNIKSIPHNTINVIFKDTANNLWVGTNDGLCKYDRDNDNFIRYGSKQGLEATDIRTAHISQNGYFWIGGKEGLFLYDAIQKKTIKVFKHNPNNLQSLSHNHVETVLEDSKGRIWVGLRYEGLNCLPNVNSNKFISYKKSTTNSQSISSNVVRTLHEDKYGNIWIGTKKALEQLTPLQQKLKNPNFVHYNRIEGDENSITQNSIFSFYEDKFGNFWIGFYSEGLDYVYNGKQKFKHFKNNIYSSHSLTNNMTSSFAMNEMGIWVGTKGGGLELFNIETEKFTHYLSSKNIVNSPNSSKNIKALLVDKDKDLWVGAFEGLYKYNKANKQFKWVLKDKDIYCLAQGIDNNIWVGTRNSLFKIDKQTNNITNYKRVSSDSTSLSSELINTIYKDSNNQIWVGTKFGLNLYNRQKDNFIQYFHNPKNKQSLSNSTITSITEDKNNNIWIATLDGLNKYNIKKNNFKRFSEKDGLPNSIINNLWFDSKEYLWITTVKGLSKLNPNVLNDTLLNSKDLLLKNYDYLDGLQDIDFLPNSLYQSKTGEVFIGGVNGFNIFNTDSIENNMVIPKVYITNFKIFNKTVIPKEKNSPLKNRIEFTNQIELDHNQTFITFEYVALNYTLPKKNQYAYKMEGFDKEWNYVGNNLQASYTNLQPGSYNFKVKASNNDGIWNEEGTSIAIIVNPPWWETWWFRSLVLLVIFIVLIIFYYVRLNNLRLQKIELTKKVKERTLELEESNAAKDKFFSIIAHDLKNPFSTMLGFLEILQTSFYKFNDEKKLDMISMAYKSSERLFKLTENLLMWSQSQRGILPFKPECVDLKELTSNELAILEGMYKEKYINVTLINNNPNLKLMADKNMLAMVFRNLVSNAIKFTNEKGEITINISKTNQAILFEITDSGIGIPKNKVNQLFNISSKFIRNGTSKEKGTGLGLVLCQEHIAKHNGKIWVESEEGKGSSFFFTIPLNICRQNQIKELNT